MIYTSTCFLNCFVESNRFELYTNISNNRSAKKKRKSILNPSPCRVPCEKDQPLTVN